MVKPKKKKEKRIHCTRFTTQFRIEADRYYAHHIKITVQSESHDFYKPNTSMRKLWFKPSVNVVCAKCFHSKYKQIHTPHSMLSEILTVRERNGQRWWWKDQNIVFFLFSFLRWNVCAVRRMYIPIVIKYDMVNNVIITRSEIEIQSFGNGWNVILFNQ